MYKNNTAVRMLIAVLFYILDKCGGDVYDGIKYIGKRDILWCVNIAKLRLIPGAKAVRNAAERLRKHMNRSVRPESGAMA